MLLGDDKGKETRDATVSNAFYFEFSFMIRRKKVEILQFELKLQLESVWIKRQNGLGVF